MIDTSNDTIMHIFKRKCRDIFDIFDIFKISTFIIIIYLLF